MPYWTVTLALLVVACGLPQDTAPWEPVSARDWERKISSVNEILLNDGELGRIPEFFSESYIPPGSGWQAGGHEAIRGYLQALRTAFPDLRVEIHVLVAQEDRVAWIRTHRGTHLGEFKGVPGTGRVLTWQDMIVTQFEDDMIAMEWGVSGLPGVIRAP